MTKQNYGIHKQITRNAFFEKLKATYPKTKKLRILTLPGLLFAENPKKSLEQAILDYFPKAEIIGIEGNPKTGEKLFKRHLNNERVKIFIGYDFDFIKQFKQNEKLDAVFLDYFGQFDEKKYFVLKSIIQKHSKNTLLTFTTTLRNRCPNQLNKKILKLRGKMDSEFGFLKLFKTNQKKHHVKLLPNVGYSNNDIAPQAMQMKFYMFEVKAAKNVDAA